MTMKINSKEYTSDYFKSDKKYYNPMSFLVLAPTFSFLLPAILYSINIGNSENKKKMMNYIIFFIFLFAFTCIVNFFSYDAIVGLVGENNFKHIYAGFNGGFGAYFYSKQEPHYKIWKNLGGKNKSLVLPIFLAITVCIPIIYYLVNNPFANVSEYIQGKHKIYYDEEISETEIKELFSKLKEIGVIKDNDTFEALIKNTSKSYEYYFAVKDEYIDSEEVKEIKIELENNINKEGFLKKKFVLVQVDSSYNKVGKLN